MESVGEEFFMAWSTRQCNGEAVEHDAVDAPAGGVGGEGFVQETGRDEKGTALAGVGCGGESLKVTAKEDEVPTPVVTKIRSRSETPLVGRSHRSVHSARIDEDNQEGLPPAVNQKPVVQPVLEPGRAAASPDPRSDMKLKKNGKGKKFIFPKSSTKEPIRSRSTSVESLPSDDAIRPSTPVITPQTVKGTSVIKRTSCKGKVPTPQQQSDKGLSSRSQAKTCLKYPGKMSPAFPQVRKPRVAVHAKKGLPSALLIKRKSPAKTNKPPFKKTRDAAYKDKSSPSDSSSESSWGASGDSKAKDVGPTPVQKKRGRYSPDSNYTDSSGTSWRPSSTSPVSSDDDYTLSDTESEEQESPPPKPVSEGSPATPFKTVSTQTKSTGTPLTPAKVTKPTGRKISFLPAPKHTQCTLSFSKKVFKPLVACPGSAGKVGYYRPSVETYKNLAAPTPKPKEKPTSTATAQSVEKEKLLQKSAPSTTSSDAHTSRKNKSDGTSGSTSAPRASSPRPGHSGTGTSFHKRSTCLQDYEYNIDGENDLAYAYPNFLKPVAEPKDIPQAVGSLAKGNALDKILDEVRSKCFTYVKAKQYVYCYYPSRVHDEAVMKSLQSFFPTVETPMPLESFKPLYRCLPPKNLADMANGKALYVSGDSSTGKTFWGKALFHSFLFIDSKESLKKFNPLIHKGIVLDEFKADAVTFTIQSFIAFGETEKAGSIRILYGTLDLPKGVPRVLISNYSMEETFMKYLSMEEQNLCLDGDLTQVIAGASRYSVMHISEKVFIPETGRDLIFAPSTVSETGHWHNPPLGHFRDLVKVWRANAKARRVNLESTPSSTPRSASRSESRSGSRRSTPRAGNRGKKSRQSTDMSVAD